MKTIQGIVESVKTAQTAQVSVARMWQHPMYLKSVKRTKNFACHYADVTLEVGDVVEIMPCRPISKTKSFIVVKKVGK